MRKRKPATGKADLWHCPRCGRPFANRNQEHSCGVWTLEHHFHARPKARRLYDAFLAAVRECGPVQTIPAKTRIGLQTRMIFAAVMPRRDYLRGHLVLARRVEDPRFLGIDTFSPRNHVHAFELREESDLDARLRRFIREAYAVGEQEHLGRRPDDSAR
ncbi:MAG: hypothetical protein HYZ28_27800 [Myxococcales bacterium]|nr:hypothetical protein [Myxococcales bacterium]